jgi:2-keto-3-deoxy-L-rhamnonate aldolase RhmA
MSVAPTFRSALLKGRTLLGTFVKTPAPQTTEVLGLSGLDFVVIDQEHAPFDRGSIDLALLGARSVGLAALVRVPSEEHILGALDDGATGVLVPHVSSPERARKAVSLCRYRGGSRGFSNTTRAGRYGGIPLVDHLDVQDRETTVIAMIEDVAALDPIDEIVATPGLDAVFIGRGDLTVALGASSMASPETRAATDRILEACIRADKRVCIMVADAAEAAEFKARGASAFIVGSDQGFMRQAASKTVADFARLKS